MNAKWSDDEDDLNFEMRQKGKESGISLPTKLKEEPDQIKSNSFLGWVKKPSEKKLILNQKPQNLYSVKNLLKREQNNSSINKQQDCITSVSKTVKHHSLKSSVKSIDRLQNGFQNNNTSKWLFCGLGKTLKTCDLFEDRNEYDITNSFFFNNESFLKTRFLDSNKTLSHLLKKRYVTLFDLEKEKATRLSKLFTKNTNQQSQKGGKSGIVDFMEISLDKKLIGVSSNNLFSVMDSRSRMPVFEKHLLTKIQRFCFSDSHKLIYQSNSGLLSLDLR